MTDDDLNARFDTLREDLVGRTATEPATLRRAA
jgi:hypothetical protein